MTVPILHNRFAIRPATADDLPSVLALLADAQLAPNAIEAQFGPQFAVAVDQALGTVVGAAGIERYDNGHADVGLLRSAVVDPDWRGQGVGAALTRDRLQWARGHALQALFLLTETAADYWPRFGFDRIARDSAPAVLMASHEWKHGCPASAIAMRLSLSPTDPIKERSHLEHGDVGSAA